MVLGAGLLMLLPVMVQAEVSVQLDRQGRIRRVNVLTRESPARQVIWGQVRGRQPLQVLLNPLGDTYGDLAPVVTKHPATGHPWVVWPRNEGNQKRIVLSFWDGKSWTAPARIAPADLMGYDQLNPRLVFDAAGVPLLVYTEAAPDSRVLFATLARGVWTPPLLLSDRQVDSRTPSSVLQGSDLVVSYETPAGRVTRMLPTSYLVESAVNLMDSPIPPGAQPTPPELPGGGGEDPGEPFVNHR